MRMHLTVALSMLTGVAIGGSAVQALQAQTKSPVYYVAEIDTPNIDAYMKDYAPVAQAAIKAAGGKFLASGQAKGILGDPPKTRTVIQVWESEEQIQKWLTSDENKKAREIATKLGTKFRTYTLNGTPQ